MKVCHQHCKSRKPEHQCTLHRACRRIGPPCFGVITISGVLWLGWTSLGPGDKSLKHWGSGAALPECSSYLLESCITSWQAGRHYQLGGCIETTFRECKKSNCNLSWSLADLTHCTPCNKNPSPHSLAFQELALQAHLHKWAKLDNDGRNKERKSSSQKTGIPSFHTPALDSRERAPSELCQHGLIVLGPSNHCLPNHCIVLEKRTSPYCECMY